MCSFVGEEKNRIKGIIALDLDGTLLNSKKELSEGNLHALRCAAEAGWAIVPTTGRFYGGMPEVIRQLPFVHYAITINGAAVLDLTGREQKTLYRAEIPWEKAVEIMTWLDEKPVIYDCYMNHAAWMTEGLKAQVNQVIEDEKIRKMFHDLRQPVPELKEFIASYAPEKGIDVQKVQFFTRDMDLRKRLLEEIPQVFPGILATSSSPQNIELNWLDANKGKALMALAKVLGVDPKNTLAFGDGLNDVAMILAAGIGFAMENAEPEVKAVADRIALSCDADGVAYGIEAVCGLTLK